MSTIVTRAGKGSPLTNTEVDSNFINLNTDKIEAATTVTLTNKTLTSPKINEILDTSGNEILGLSATASATDFLTVKNGIGTGVPLHIYADGSSTNVGLHIQPKGSGLVTISDGTDFNKGIRFRSSGSAASAVTLLDAVATAGRVVTLPDATTTLVGRDTTDTLTNKTIAFGSNTFSGSLAIANGGTGQTTANAAFNALAPSQTGNSGKYLTTDGTDTSWASNPLGTVTSVSGTGTVSGISLSGTVTTSGNLTLGGALDLSAYNGAGAFTKLQLPSGTGDLSWGGAYGVGVPTVVGSTSGGGSLTIYPTGSTLTGVASFSSSGLAVTGTLSASTSISTGTGNTTTAGLKLINGTAGFASGWGAIYAESVTPSNLNFMIAGRWDGLQTNINTATGGLIINSVNNSEVTRVSSTGLAVTGTISATTPIATTSGGTNLTSFTSGGVVYASSSSALATGSALTFDGSTLVSKGATNGNIVSVGGSGSSHTGYSQFQGYTGNGDASNINYALVGNKTGSSYLGIPNGGVGLDVVYGSSFSFALQESEILRLTSSSLYTASGINVGIGTSNIGAGNRLNVVGNNVTFSPNTDGKETFVFTTGAADKGILYIKNNTTNTVKLDTNGDSYLNGGNVGIGTSSPTYNLDVNKTLSNLTSAVAGRIGLKNGSYFASMYAYQEYYADTIGIGFTTTNAGTQSEKMYLSASGNLGLGVTPSAWSGGYKAFEVNAGSVSATTGAGNLIVSNNSYYNGTNWIYKATGVASDYAQTGGQHWFRTAASGTAGNAITFTQAMTLTSDARLFVGTTSESGSNDSRAVFKSDDASGVYRCLALETTVTTSRTVQTFRNGNGQVGDIATNGTATAYNTSSDYRLKNITGSITTSGAYIDSLNPVEGTWKTDGSTFVGLIAHEVQEASRTQVVTGTKDGQQMQSMDYSNSELIANLIAEVKSLRQRVATLEAQ